MGCVRNGKLRDFVNNRDAKRKLMNTKERDLKRSLFEGLNVPQNLLAQTFEFALAFLEKGRPGFDVPHTMAVMFHANRLAQEFGLDSTVLVLAAALHDIGYYGEFDGQEGAGLSQVVDKKAKHMIVGGVLARKFLYSEVVANDLADVQKERIIHLVEVHDKIRELVEVDEIALMKADSLGAIDVDWVLPTYKGDEALRYLNDHGALRRSLFVEKFGASDYDELTERFRNFIYERDGVR